jgi:lysozyme family protein
MKTLLILFIASISSVAAYGIIKVSQSHQQTYNAWITHVEKYEGNKIDTIRPNPEDITTYRYVSRSVEWKTFLAMADTFQIPATVQRFEYLTDDDVFKIREQFWYMSGANNIEDLAIAAFFAEMYYSAPASIRYFQERLQAEGFANLKVTGKLNEQTIKAIESQPKKQMWEWLLKQRKNYIYNKTASPAMQIYRKGLMIRANDFHQKFESFLGEDNMTQETDSATYENTKVPIEELLQGDSTNQQKSTSQTNPNEEVKIIVSSVPLQTPRNGDTTKRKENVVSGLKDDELKTISDTDENGVRIVVTSENEQ